MLKLAFFLLALSACVTPRPGTCVEVCAWERPTDETGRIFQHDAGAPPDH